MFLCAVQAHPEDFVEPDDLKQQRVQRAKKRAVHAAPSEPSMVVRPRWKPVEVVRSSTTAASLDDATAGPGSSASSIGNNPAGALGALPVGAMHAGFARVAPIAARAFKSSLGLDASGGVGVGVGGIGVDASGSAVFEPEVARAIAAAGVARSLPPQTRGPTVRTEIAEFKALRSATVNRR